ncbi:hypothetical protein SEPCBS119000_000778 [Sporothrix epigloea]|uniref:Uncharacterized protein n=1 Tax=Sporothrix epigloea TaxID=1892477 RepID=A0ABP0D715_9PEZI
MQRSNAVRHRTARNARSGTHREYLLHQQQQLQTVEQEYFGRSQTDQTVLDDCEDCLAVGLDNREACLDFAVATSGIDMDQGGYQSGATDAVFPQACAARSLTGSPTQFGIRSDAPLPASSSSISSRTSPRTDGLFLSATHSSAMISFHEMGIAAPASPLKTGWSPVQTESRFREEL